MSIEDRVLNKNFDLDCFFANTVHVDAHITAYYEVECYLKVKLNDSRNELCDCAEYVSCPYRNRVEFRVIK